MLGRVMAGKGPFSFWKKSDWKPLEVKVIMVNSERPLLAEVVEATAAKGVSMEWTDCMVRMRKHVLYIWLYRYYIKTVPSETNESRCKVPCGRFDGKGWDLATSRGF